MTPYQKLQFEASVRGAGAYRLVCPKCQGGGDKELSLSLAVDERGQMSFRCFRASCGWGGGQKISLPKKREPRYFTADTVSVSEERQCWFRHKFGFVPPDTLYAPFMDRYVYKVMGPASQVRGYIARSFAGATPKVLTYNERPEEPFIGWSFASLPYPPPVPTVIVEDWLSCEKIAESGAAHSVALNGTYLSLEMVREILEMATGQVILALDRDAYRKTLKYQQEYGDLFQPRLRVWLLEQDLKYESADAIRRAVIEHESNFTRSYSDRRAFEDVS